VDFSYSEDQQAILELARQILTDGTSQERLREVERTGPPRFDRELWARLADAGLLGLAIAEEHGGSGLSFLEVAAIAEQVGRTVAPVPLLETLVLGALPLAEFGAAPLRAEWLPRVAKGSAVLTAALAEPEGEVLRPAVRARREGKGGDGLRLSGSKPFVPAAEIADALLVPASLEGGGLAVALVEARAPGVRITPLDTTSGQPEARVDFEGTIVPAGAVLAARGEEIVAWMLERESAALASLALGVCEEALRLTAEYAKTRKQFGQPIAMFQAVGHRAADAYIDTEGIRLTALQAAWRISAGLPAAEQVAVAAHWACQAGQRVVHAAQHLHGGIGVDTEYPLHRHFLWAKRLELALGGSTRQLLRLGNLLAGATG
jgi:alkylation response protein AidB-like acyl-CoA dehydrogenase